MCVGIAEHTLMPLPFLPAPPLQVRICQRAYRYAPGIPLGWYRDVGEMAGRLCLDAEEAETALRLAKVYYAGLGRDPDSPSPMQQAKRIMESYRARGG